MSAIALPRGLGLADDDALRGRCACFALDRHGNNGKEKA